MNKNVYALALAALLSAAASAQTTTQTTTQTTPQSATPPAKAIVVSLAQDQIKTSTVDGKTVETVLPSPKTVLPGDVLREEVTAQNVANVVIRSAVINVPVPKGTTYAGSVTLSPGRWATLYSADGGKTYAAAPLKTVTATENGKTVTKKVPAVPADYTNVRWVIAQLAPKESLKLSFRVKIN